MTKWSSDQPNNGLKPLPPEGFQLNAAQTMRLVEVASMLARLDEAAELLANPRVFNNVLPMLEITASSRIENIVTTHDELFIAEAIASQPVSLATSQAIRNRRALNLGIETVATRPISIKLIRAIATELLGHDAQVRNLPGTFIGNSKTRIYTPPEGKERIEGMLRELIEFVGAGNLHPILTMCFAHYQFEAIHPFTDGNGRTGRALNLLILLQSGLLKNPVLNLSNSMVEQRERYYNRLHSVEATGDWGGWIDFMLDMVANAAADSHRKLKEISLAQIKFEERMANGKHAKELTQLLFEKPYCQIAHLVDRLNVSRPTAAKMLETLVASGELDSFVSGKDKIFVNRKLLEVLQ